MQENKVSLYFSEGSSDKEYHCQIEAANDGFVVNFQYGRRGAALTSGSKTTSPVDFAAAKKIFDKLVKEKTSKGYTPDASGASYVGTELAGNKTDFVPQLLNSITETEAMALIADNGWVAQEKMDGERRGAHVVDGIAAGMNRKGLMTALPATTAQELLNMVGNSGPLRVDGEIIGEVLYVFDLHVKGGSSIRQTHGFLERIRLAEEMISGFDRIKVVPVAVGTAQKQALWSRVKRAHGEGIVFKRRDCLVKEGRPNSGGDWLKYKLTESASCRVFRKNPSKRSVAIELFDENGAPVSVGNVTIPPNYDIPDVGAIVEVEYLYAFKGGSLYQPVYQGERTDVDLSACTTAQLKYKPGGCDDEDQ